MDIVIGEAQLLDKVRSQGARIAELELVRDAIATSAEAVSLELATFKALHEDCSVNQNATEPEGPGPEGSTDDG